MLLQGSRKEGSFLFSIFWPSERILLFILLANAQDPLAHMTAVLFLFIAAKPKSRKYVEYEYETSC